MNTILLSHYRRVKSGQIYVAFNAQFAAYIERNELVLSDRYRYWCDGFLGRVLLKTGTHTPGRVVLADILGDAMYRNVAILGAKNIPNILSSTYRDKSFFAIPLGFGGIEALMADVNGIRFEGYDAAIICIPSPKQELLALRLAESGNSPRYGYFCLGGALNMLIGLERPPPLLFHMWDSSGFGDYLGRPIFEDD